MRRKDVPVDDIENLIRKVRTLESNSVYRYAGLVNEFDCDWQNTLDKILSSYEDTILYNYFTSKQYLRGRELPVLRKCINDYIKDFNVDDNAIYVHFRLGDATCQKEPRVWLNVFNQGNLFLRIKNHIKNNPNINKIIVVTAMHFDPRSADYRFTSAKIKYNELLLRTSLQNISRTTDGLPIVLLESKNKLSNVDLVDFHLGHLCTCKHVVLDDISCWSGLGSLLRDLRCDYISELESIPKHNDAGKIVDGYQIMHNGLKIVENCYHPEYVTYTLKTYKHFEPDQELWFHKALQTINSNGTMIELGSYWGYYSMWFNKSISNATNILVDSNTKHFNVGKENFKVNNLHGIFENLHVGAYNDSTTTTVDSIIERNNLDYIDIVHADIQFAEYEMLIGCRKAIAAKKIKWFFISTHNAGLTELCTKYLAKHNYEILESRAENKIPSTDGLIVARLK